jgi:hypothetical protein
MFRMARLVSELLNATLRIGRVAFVAQVRRNELLQVICEGLENVMFRTGEVCIVTNESSA